MTVENAQARKHGLLWPTRARELMTEVAPRFYIGSSLTSLFVNNDPIFSYVSRPLHSELFPFPTWHVEKFFTKNIKTQSQFLKEPFEFSIFLEPSGESYDFPSRSPDPTIYATSKSRQNWASSLENRSSAIKILPVGFFSPPATSASGLLKHLKN